MLKIRVSFNAQLGGCNNNNEINLMCYVFFFSFSRKIKLIHKALLIQTTSGLNLILKLRDQVYLLNYTSKRTELLRGHIKHM